MDEESPVVTGISESMLKEVGDREPGALSRGAACLLENFKEQTPQLDESERLLVELIAKALREDALFQQIRALPKRPETTKEDHFPEIERRGLLKSLGLRFAVVRGGKDLFVISGDVNDVVSERGAVWSHARWRKPGESDDEALRSAIIEFFEHETDHGLWRDGKHIIDPHEGEDPNSI